MSHKLPSPSSSIFPISIKLTPPPISSPPLGFTSSAPPARSIPLLGCTTSPLFSLVRGHALLPPPDTGAFPWLLTSAPTYETGPPLSRRRDALICYNSGLDCDWAAFELVCVWDRLGKVIDCEGGLCELDCVFESLGVVKEPFGIVSTGGESVSAKPSSLKGGLGFLVLHSAKCTPDPLP